MEEKKKGGKREKKEMTPLRFVLSRGRGEASCARRSAPRGAGSAQSSCQPRAALARGVRPAARADALPRPRGPPADTGTAAAPFRGRRGLRGAARRASAAAGRDVPGQAIAAERPPPAPRHSSLEQTKLSELRKKKNQTKGGGTNSLHPHPAVFCSSPRRAVGPRPALPGQRGMEAPACALLRDPLPTRQPHGAVILFCLLGLVTARSVLPEKPPRGCREPVPAAGAAGHRSSQRRLPGRGGGTDGHRRPAPRTPASAPLLPSKRKPTRQTRELGVPLACARVRSLL